MNLKALIKSIEGLFKRSLYQKIGGQKTIDLLVDDFYHIMQTDPDAKDCLATHAGKEIHISAEKLKYFLSGWLGGPQLYLEKYGHPRLRMRHFPFAIGEKESVQWIYCMKKALENSSIKPVIQEEMLTAFTRITELVKNRD